MGTIQYTMHPILIILAITCQQLSLRNVGVPGMPVYITTAAIIHWMMRGLCILATRFTLGSGKRVSQGFPVWDAAAQAWLPASLPGISAACPGGFCLFDPPAEASNKQWGCWWQDSRDKDSDEERAALGVLSDFPCVNCSCRTGRRGRSARSTLKWGTRWAGLGSSPKGKSRVPCCRWPQNGSCLPR